MEANKSTWIIIALVIAVVGVWIWGSAKASNLQESLDHRPTWADFDHRVQEATYFGISQGYHLGYTTGLKGNQPDHFNDADYTLKDQWSQDANAA